MESGRGNEGPHPLFPRGGSSTPISHRARRRDARIGGGESRARDGRRGATRATVSEQKKKTDKRKPHRQWLPSQLRHRPPRLHPLFCLTFLRVSGRTRERGCCRDGHMTISSWWVSPRVREAPHRAIPAKPWRSASARAAEWGRGFSFWKRFRDLKKKKIIFEKVWEKQKSKKGFRSFAHYLYTTPAPGSSPAYPFI